MSDKTTTNTLPQKLKEALSELHAQLGLGGWISLITLIVVLFSFCGGHRDGGRSEREGMMNTRMERNMMGGERNQQGLQGQQFGQRNNSQGNDCPFNNQTNDQSIQGSQKTQKSSFFSKFFGNKSTQSTQQAGTDTAQGQNQQALPTEQAPQQPSQSEQPVAPTAEQPAVTPVQ